MVNIPYIFPCASNDKAYQFLPFHFMRLLGRTLLVNKGGQFLFLDNCNFSRFTQGTLKNTEEIFLDLKAKHFLTDGNMDLPVEMLATKYRTKKAFLRSFTSLHMLVLTVRCNQKCKYCQVACEKADARRFDMQPDTAKKSVDLVFQSPSPFIKIEFQGGEPFLNFDVLRLIVEYAEELNAHYQKNLAFVVCTNLSDVNKDHLEYCKEHKIFISTSLDGPQSLHDLYRTMQDGEGSYVHLMAGLDLARGIVGSDSISALMTTTHASLGHFPKIVDEYITKGFTSIFFRSLNPYGRAISGRAELGYSVEEFVRSYRDGLDYIIELNLRGTWFMENYATLLLTRILTPFGTGFVDLQSPAGAGIACAIYDYDGNVYVSDEGRMLARNGDNTFLMGNVHKDDYRKLFKGDVIKRIVEKSCVECLPRCSDCAFNIWCGADPVRNYATQGDMVVHKPTDDFCKKNMHIIQYLLEKVVFGNEDTKDVFWSWITKRHLNQVRCIESEYLQCDA